LNGIVAKRDMKNTGTTPAVIVKFIIEFPFIYDTSNIINISDEILHVVWFKDARSFDARAVLVGEYDLQGLSLWTIMIFDSQMWLIINNQYYIEKPIIG
jgi:hypothetical protein